MDGYIDNPGYHPYQGSATLNLVSERGVLLPYEDDALPYREEMYYSAVGRRAIFTPHRLKFADAYAHAFASVNQDNGISWDYASNYMYVRPHVQPYPYLISGNG